MGQTAKAKWPQTLLTQERIVQAKTKTKNIVNHLLEVLALHESNRVLLFSDVLSKQVPRSHAAHTFRLLCDSQYRYELARLCALWDFSSADRESIPAIADLVDDDAVRVALAQEAENHWIDLPKSFLPSEQLDDETRRFAEELVEASEREFGAKQFRKALRWLKSADKMAMRVRKCERYLALVDERDGHVAHNLSAGAKRKAPHVTMKYGDDTWLLALSTRIVDNMYLGICGISFDWEGSQKISRKRSQAFWNGISIKVLE